MADGPVPKRSDQRRRRNKVDISRVNVDGTVVAPDLDLDDVHPLAVDMYDAICNSGQAKFYEPSDYVRARVFCKLLSDQLNAGRVSSMMYAALQKDMEALLVAEGDRRRARMEIERAAPDDSAEKAKVSRMDAYRKAAST